MSDVERLRAEAEFCRELALTASGPISEDFTRLAVRWQELADEQQKTEARASRLSLWERFRRRQVQRGAI
jgi:hypothetical protein